MFEFNGKPKHINSIYENYIEVNIRYNCKLIRLFIHQVNNCFLYFTGHFSRFKKSLHEETKKNSFYVSLFQDKWMETSYINSKTSLGFTMKICRLSKLTQRDCNGKRYKGIVADKYALDF